MEYRKAGDHVLLRLDPQDEIVSSVQSLCEQEHIMAASVSGLGAADKVTVGAYDTMRKRFDAKTFTGMFEIASLIGNVTQKDGKPYLHLHIVFGNPITGDIHAGHLANAVISATAEIVLTVIPYDVGREENQEIGLNLWKF